MFGSFGRLRRRRNESEYPEPDSPAITQDDADDCIRVAATILDVAQKLLGSGNLGRYS